MKRALICGISGQDGALLAALLLKKGYRVTGTTRQDPQSKFDNLFRLGIRDRVTIHRIEGNDANALRKVLADDAPHEIYYLAAQSSVARSFEIPEHTFQSIAGGSKVLLPAVRDLRPSARVFMAGSGDMFGNLDGKPAVETTPPNPVSPYGEARAAAYLNTRKFRGTFGLFACTGILFNHESCLRPERFVTRKIVRTAWDIARGRCRELVLGNLEIARDWGWAPEYVDAMWRMLQQEIPQDFVIATGTTLSLKEFVKTVFDHLDLDWRAYVKTDQRFYRPSDIPVMAADPSRARQILGWRARYTGYDVADLMVAAERDSLKSSV